MTNPKIKTLGILSASNNAGLTLSASQNDRRDEALRLDLAGYRLRQVRGDFGRVDEPLLSLVNPFVVANVAREIVVTLGAKYHQFHVIYGQEEGEGKDWAMRFELVGADWEAPVLAMRRLFAHPDQQQRHLEEGFPGDRGRFFVVPTVDEHEFEAVDSISPSESSAPGATLPPEPRKDHEHILAFCRESTRGALDAIRRVARLRGIRPSGDEGLTNGIVSSLD